MPTSNSLGYVQLAIPQAQEFPSPRVNWPLKLHAPHQSAGGSTTHNHPPIPAARKTRASVIATREERRRGDSLKDWQHRASHGLSQEVKFVPSTQIWHSHMNWLVNLQPLPTTGLRSIGFFVPGNKKKKRIIRYWQTSVTFTTGRHGAVVRIKWQNANNMASEVLGLAYWKCSKIAAVITQGHCHQPCPLGLTQSSLSPNTQETPYPKLEHICKNSTSQDRSRAFPLPRKFLHVPFRQIHALLGNHCSQHQSSEFMSFC